MNERERKEGRGVPSLDSKRKNAAVFSLAHLFLDRSPRKKSTGPPAAECVPLMSDEGADEQSRGVH